MKKSLAISLFAAVTGVACCGAEAKANIIPPIGLAPGSEYQLIFVTVDDTLGTNTNINFYNAFVTAEAALNPSLPSATWYAVGSTAAVDAYVNAPNVIVSGSYLPVYNTQGIQVSGPSGFYSGLTLNPIAYDLTGTYWSGSNVMTGSTINGTAFPSETLGSPFLIEHGNSTNNVWSQSGTGGNEGRMYGLSSPLIVPTPEPTSIALFGSALSLLAGFRLLNRRRRPLATRAIASP